MAAAEYFWGRLVVRATNQLVPRDVVSFHSNWRLEPSRNGELRFLEVMAVEGRRLELRRLGNYHEANVQNTLAERAQLARYRLRTTRSVLNYGAGKCWFTKNPIGLNDILHLCRSQCDNSAYHEMVKAGTYRVVIAVEPKQLILRPLQKVYRVSVKDIMTAAVGSL